MKIFDSGRCHFLWSAMLAGVALFLGGSLPAGAAVRVLRFTDNDAPNANAPVYYLNDPSLNGKPTAKLIVTQRNDSVANNHPIGVWFDARQAPKGMWGILNEDGTTIPTGAGFNVLVGPCTVTVASAANSLNYATRVTAASGRLPFNPPVTPPAKPGFLFFAHDYEPYPGLGGGVRVPHHQGVFYTSGPGNGPPGLFKKWAIENLDAAPAVAASYFIFDASTPPKGATVFGHSTTSLNRFGNVSLISNMATDNKPGAVVFITPISDVDDKAFCVSYNSIAGHWTISPEDGTTITNGQDFNVLVFPGVTP